MRTISSKGRAVRSFIVERVNGLTAALIKDMTSEFKISRQSAYQYIKNMVKNNEIEKMPGKRGIYILKPLLIKDYTYSLKKHNDESAIWIKDIRPQLPKDLKENIILICQYGFTEIFNNALEHSSSEKAVVRILYDAMKIILIIRGLWCRDIQKNPGRF